MNQLLLYFNIRFFTYKNTHCFTTKEAGSIKRFFEISTLKGWDVTDHLKDKLTSFLEKEERNINPEIVDLILDHLAKTSPPTQYIDGLSGSLRSALQDSIEDIYRIWPTTNEIVIVQPEAVESIIGALLSAIATALNPMPEDLLFELGVLRPLANHQNLMSRFYGRIIDPALTKALHNIGITNPSCISFFTNALKLLFSLSPVNNTASNASGLHYLDCDTTTSKLETLVRVHLAVSTEDADTSRKEAEVMALISTQLESEKESRKVYQYLVATFDVFVEKLEKKGIALDRAKRIAFGLLTFVGGLFVTQPPGMLFFLFSGANDWGYIGADLFFMAVGLIASVALGGTSYTFSFEQGKKNLRKLGSCLSCSCFFQTPEESLLPTTDPLALMADGLRDMRMSSILTGEENDLEAPLLAAPH